MNLATELKDLQRNVRPSPWKGYEHFRGYGVMMLPFSSGHLLGLRVFPENDFAPYHSVWHRDPDGNWSIYNDGPSLNTTCPRWWGPALEHNKLTKIDLMWTGPNDLKVEMKEPQLKWRMKMTDTSLLRWVNAANAAMPLWTWRLKPLVRLREWLAKQTLDMGDIRFAFTTPRGQEAVFITEQLFIIKSSEASWKGEDLGDPVRLEENPTIGDVPLPTRPIFVIGEAHGKIVDEEEYEKTREKMREENIGGSSS